MTKRKADIDVRRGQGETDTMWKGCLFIYSPQANRSGRVLCASAYLSEVWWGEDRLMAVRM